MKLPSLSIILPAYNEEANIEKVVRQANSIAKEIANDYEIIVVNDGSKDRTEELSLNLKNEIPNLKVISQENKGYGGALKTGFENVTKDWIFFTDSDLQFDLNELKNFIEHTKDYNFIFGYRIKRADNPHRILIAQMLKKWNYILLGFPIFIIDIDCAYKLMKTDKFKSIGEIMSTGGMVTTEFILKIHRKGYRIKQIGVQHYPRVAGKSTGSNFNVIKKAVNETFKLRKLLK